MSDLCQVWIESAAQKCVKNARSKLSPVLKHPVQTEPLTSFAKVSPIIAILLSPGKLHLLEQTPTCHQWYYGRAEWPRIAKSWPRSKPTVALQMAFPSLSGDVFRSMMITWQLVAHFTRFFVRTGMAVGICVCISARTCGSPDVCTCST